METTFQEKTERTGKSITIKALIVGALTLLMLIPGVMIENLILERQHRSNETIAKLNEKWSNAQTLNGPILTLPYLTKKMDEKKKIVIEKHELYLTPESLAISVKLTPEVRHYGIYKTILYKSKITINGNFEHLNTLPIDGEVNWDEAYITMGISDLRGIENNPEFMVGNMKLAAKTEGISGIGKENLVFYLKDKKIDVSKTLNFNCNFDLKGSSNMNFIPIGKNTRVEMEGDWKSPGFIGSYSPEYTISKDGFKAKWEILNFNRSIPDYWVDGTDDYGNSSFGVNLVDTVDQYQLNMRSAKYAIMFILLTFVVFFFVEILTYKKIHPLQYLLVGFALVLFYSLLLSISEQIGFGKAYLIASASTIVLITAYAQSIFKNVKQTTILAALLSLLYLFLYVILQLEDIALLIGSVGLFVILGIIMAITRKIKWYNEEEEYEEEVNTDDDIHNKYR